jgi:subtilase family serine protease
MHCRQIRVKFCGPPQASELSMSFSESRLDWYVIRCLRSSISETSRLQGQTTKPALRSKVKRIPAYLNGFGCSIFFRAVKMRAIVLTFLHACLALGAVVVEDTPVLPQGWRQVNETVSGDEPILLSIAMRQPDIGQLTVRMVQSGKGQHMLQHEAWQLQQPKPEDVTAVLNWLEENGVENARPAEDFIRVSTTVENVEKLLDTKIQRYTFKDKPSVRRARRYSVPDSVAEAIAFVHPLSNFMSPHKKLSSRSPQQVARRGSLRARERPCSQITTPSCVRELYGINYNAADNEKSGVRLGVAGFLEQNANYLDALSSLHRNRPEASDAGYNFSVELINGAENQQNPRYAGDEAGLDIQYTLPLAYPANITYYLAAGRGLQVNESGEPKPEEFRTNEPYLEFLEYLLKKPDNDLPHVLSISYADDELSVPRPYAERVCSMLGLLTARGTSIFVGSGDGGARGAHNSSCRTHDGTGRKTTMATFPSTCPWVTAVGAVTNASPLTGANFSTGGFSQYFTQPDWQKDAVGAYVKALDGYLDGLYNGSMRATPDIAALGTNFNVQIALQITRLDGTSASTPVIASMIALVNDARLRQGKKSLGWLNRRLYSDEVRRVLTDVEIGSSLSCDFGEDGKPGGWPVEKGWDAVTGLGVPQSFKKLFEVLVQEN